MDKTPKHVKSITTLEFDKFSGIIFDEKLKQANLAIKLGIATSDNSFGPKLSFFITKKTAKFEGNCLMQDDDISFANINVNLFILNELDM